MRTRPEVIFYKLGRGPQQTLDLLCLELGITQPPKLEEINCVSSPVYSIFGIATWTKINLTSSAQNTARETSSDCPPATVLNSKSVSGVPTSAVLAPGLTFYTLSWVVLSQHEKQENFLYPSLPFLTTISQNSFIWKWIILIPNKAWPHSVLSVNIGMRIIFWHDLLISKQSSFLSLAIKFKLLNLWI